MSNDLPDVSPYQLRSPIERGDIGAVYRAFAPRLGREVALKGLWGESPLSVEERRAFFENEEDILRRIDHPRIPSLYEAVDGEHPYIAMQYIDGSDLQTLMDARTEPLPIRDVLNWGIQVCEILDYLHHLEPESIAYRDLKPAHIVIDQQSCAWLVDFNLAIVLPPSRIERHASIEGTEGYAAPEQYKGKVSPASDVYSLGVVLHYLITRRDPRLEAPFSTEQILASWINPECPPGLDAAILRAVTTNIRLRTRSARTLKKALARELHRLG
jgi:serine/threonine protein kinase